ncbi:hypothetical protein [Sulfurovum sp.]|uniref:hypothetical protein n=1 Tax=Sulfurovum sp. TaxID=1969726 RepID=UPI003562E839
MLLKDPKASTTLVLIFSSVAIFLASLLLLMNFDLFSKNVFTVIRRYGDYDTPYYSLAVALLLFMGLTSIIALFRNKPLTYIWIIKAFVTLIVMIPYEMYYGLDAYMYYAEAVHFTGEHTHGKAGTFNTIFVNYIFTFIGGESYFSLKLLNSFVAYLGLVLIYKSYELIMRRSGLSLENDYFIYVFFLFPSVLFWSSILGKDPLNLLFIGIFMYGFIRFINKRRMLWLLWTVVAIIGVRYIRSWYAIIMIISIAMFYIRPKSIKRNITLIPLVPVLYISFSYFLQNQGISSFNELFYKMSYTSYTLAFGGSSLEYTHINNIWDYLFYYIPNLFTTLFRPMPWDIRNPFSLLAAVENVFLLYFTYKYIFKNWREVLKNKYLRFLILFIFSWSLFYVIISPTNLGMAVRFKLQILPAMLIVIWVSRHIYLQKQKQKKGLEEEERKQLSIGQRSKKDSGIEKE